MPARHDEDLDALFFDALGPEVGPRARALYEQGITQGSLSEPVVWPRPVTQYDLRSVRISPVPLPPSPEAKATYQP